MAAKRSPAPNSSLWQRVDARLAHLLALPVRAYRWFLSPWLGSACRFEPTCSRYALDALRDHGAVGGSYLAAHRLLRCHPWCSGGLDPVPNHGQANRASAKPPIEAPKAGADTSPSHVLPSSRIPP
jgi:uncharacterized protein